MSDPVSAKPDGRYTVEAIVSEEGIDGLEDDWNRLSASSGSPNPFMAYGWYRAWLRRLMADEGRDRLLPYVLVIRQDGKIAGIVPLVRRIVSRLGFRIRKLEFLTYHSDYNEFVVGEDIGALTGAAMDFLARFTRDWDFADLRELCGDNSRLALIEAAGVSAGLPFRLFAETGGCLYMPIEAPWSRAGVKKHLRFARRASLRFEERAVEGYRVRVVDLPHLEKGLLERVIAVEARKRVGKTLSWPFIGSYPEVFQALFDDLGPHGLLIVVLLEKGEQLVAWRFLFRYGKKLWDYLTAYDPEFADCSPGTVLVCAAIDYGFKHGCDELDFLRGMDEYKWRWTSTFRNNQRMILWNRRWLPRVGAFAYFRLRLGRR